MDRIVSSHKEERREGYVELPHNFVERLEIHVKEENALFKSLKLAGSVLGVLVMVLTWVFIEKNNDIKAMQQTLNQHSIAISDALTMLKMTIERNEKEHAGYEKNNGTK